MPHSIKDYGLSSAVVPLQLLGAPTLHPTAPLIWVPPAGAKSCVRKASTRMTGHGLWVPLCTDDKCPMATAVPRDMDGECLMVAAAQASICTNAFADSVRMSA